MWPVALPRCTGSGASLSCPSLSFPNVANGAYPIWSTLRMVWDPNDPTVMAVGLGNYAQRATSLISDFMPGTAVGVFRSHFTQLRNDTSDGQLPNNGFIPHTSRLGIGR